MNAPRASRGKPVCPWGTIKFGNRGADDERQRRRWLTDAHERSTPTSSCSERALIPAVDAG
jgi:hypothetical protein